MRVRVRTVSIPGELDSEAEALRREKGWTRSLLYAQALRALIEKLGREPK
jgi:hypothetical protein